MKNTELLLKKQKLEETRKQRGTIKHKRKKGYPKMNRSLMPFLIKRNKKYLKRTFLEYKNPQQRVAKSTEIYWKKN